MKWKNDLHNRRNKKTGANEVLLKDLMFAKVYRCKQFNFIIVNETAHYTRKAKCGMIKKVENSETASWYTRGLAVHATLFEDWASLFGQERIYSDPNK